MRQANLLVTLLAASIIATPVTAAEKKPLPGTLAEQDGARRLEPISPWNIDFGENRCRLTRLFGSQEDRHLLMLEQAAPSGSFGLTLAGSRLADFRTAGQVDLGMESDEPMVTVERFGKGSVADFGDAVIFSNISPGTATPPGPLRSAGIDLAEAATIERVVMRRGKAVLSFETGNMKDAMGALNLCTEDLLKQWGLDAAAHRSYVPPAWTNQAAVTDRIVAIYPSAARRFGEQAIFRMRVTVETDGRVSDCLIEESTVTELLKSPACKQMQSAVFEPARDAQGQPIRSFYSTTISYVMRN